MENHFIGVDWLQQKHLSQVHEWYCSMVPVRPVPHSLGTHAQMLEQDKAGSFYSFGLSGFSCGTSKITLHVSKEILDEKRFTKSSMRPSLFSSQVAMKANIKEIKEVITSPVLHGRHGCRR